MLREAEWDTVASEELHLSLTLFVLNVSDNLDMEVAGLVGRRYEPWYRQPLAQGAVENLASSCYQLRDSEDVGRPWCYQLEVCTSSRLSKVAVLLSSGGPDSCALLSSRPCGEAERNSVDGKDCRPSLTLLFSRSSATLKWKPPNRLTVGAGGYRVTFNSHSIGMGDGGVLPGLWDQVIGLIFSSLPCLLRPYPARDERPARTHPDRQTISRYMTERERHKIQ